LHQKGPIASTSTSEKATLITSPEQLIQVFGRPDKVTGGQGILGALEILESTDQLYFVRVASGTAADASATVTMGTCPAIYLSGGSTDAAELIISSVTDNAGTSKLTVIKTIDSEADATQTFSARMANDINQYSTGDGEFRYVPLGDNDGFIVGAYAGSGATINVSSAGTINMGRYEPVSGTISASGTSATALTASGGSYTSMSYLAESIWPGAGYNYTTTEYQGKTRIQGNSIEIDGTPGHGNVFTVNNDGGATEIFDVNFTPSSSDYVETVIPATYNKFNIQGSDFIVGAIKVNGSSVDLTNSEWSAALAPQTDVSINYSGSTDTLAANGGRFTKLVDGTYNMSGGSNGDQGSSTAATMASVLIGTAAEKTGIYALEDDSINVSIVAVPGYSDQTVQNSLVSLAEDTQNFVAIVSPPVGLATVQQAVDWMNGFGNGRTAAINSSWAACYWPWVQMYDAFSRASVWIDPAVYAVKAMCVTAATDEVWFAPAGLRRGRLTKPTDVEAVLNVGDRNFMYSNGNALNPIAKFAQDGIVIWGQRTAQRTPTALDRLNVRFLMIYLRKVFLQSNREYVFQPNDPILWGQVKASLDTVLRDVQRRRGITDFEVIVDETVNTPLRIERNELWAKCLIKPTKTAEIITVELNLTTQDSDFSS
jgi:phage tail sheath protein FI